MRKVRFAALKKEIDSTIKGELKRFKRDPFGLERNLRKDIGRFVSDTLARNYHFSRQTMFSLLKYAYARVDAELKKIKEQLKGTTTSRRVWHKKHTR